MAISQESYGSDEYFSVCFHVKGNNLHPSQVNPLLVQFKQMFMDIGFKDEHHTVSIISVNDSKFEQTDSQWIKCSSKIKTLITGKSDSGISKIIQKLRKLSLISGTYTKKIEISVVDIKVGDGFVRNFRIWPKELF